MRKIDISLLFLSGDSTTTDTLEANISSPSKPARKRRLDRIHNGSAIATSLSSTPTTDYSSHNNNNNHVKNERLSPGTPDTSSRSRSVTPSSASHPDTPPALENPMLQLGGRNYSDFMRSLAAKYNNTNPNEWVVVFCDFPLSKDQLNPFTETIQLHCLNYFWPEMLASSKQSASPKEHFKHWSILVSFKVFDCLFDFFAEQSASTLILRPIHQFDAFLKLLVLSSTKQS